MIEGLLWKTTGYKTIKNDSAPSWSWTSTEGVIFFEDCSGAKPLAAVMDITVNSSSKYNLFSRVTGGALTLSAPLLSALRLYRYPRQSIYYGYYREKFLIRFPNVSYTIQGDADIHATIQDDLDIHDTIQDDLNIHPDPDIGFFVCVLAQYDSSYIFGLLLRQTETGKYQRVGLVRSFFYDKSCFRRHGVTYPYEEDEEEPSWEKKKKAHDLVTALPRTEFTIV